MKNWTKFEDLPITDDWIFCEVMKNQDICREFLEKMLDIKIDKIEYQNSQQRLAQAPFRRSVRLDVYLKGDDRVFDIEMQNGHFAELPFRARYYQAMIDVENLEAAASFREVKESFVIFICSDDPFGWGLPIYTVRQCFGENGKEYLDKTHKVFYNCSAFSSERGDKKAILQFFSKARATSDFTERLESAVKTAKLSPSVRYEREVYMTTVQDWVDEQLEKGFEKIRREGFERGRMQAIAEGKAEWEAKGRIQGATEGRAEGIAEGMSKGLSTTARNLLKMGFSLEQIQQATGLPREKIEALR